MKLFELKEAFLQAVDSILANRMRSFLASLGVIIGITFVILMGWVLSGLDKAMQDTFNMLGTDVLYVDKHSWAGGENWKEERNRPDITIQQANNLIDKLKDIELASPVADVWNIQIKYLNDSYSGISVEGVNSNYGLTPSGTIVEGRFFSQNEDDFAENVICIGWKVSETIFPNGDAIGREIKVNGRKFRIIGIIKKQGTTFFDFMDYMCYVPLKTFFKTFGKFRRTLSIAVKAGSEDKLDEVREEVIGNMRIIRNLKPNEKDNFSINESKAFEAQVSGIRTVVWSVGIGMTLLSFIVGIIGIVNVMFVSIFERTKEIGIAKALGAKKRMVLTQIIFESTLLAFFGAIISFIITSLIAYITGTFVIQYVKEVQFLSPTIPLDLLGIASVISVIVGVLAGLVPAIRASNFDPVIAIRYE
jgi:putative ABC transport system permease protein